MLLLVIIDEVFCEVEFGSVYYGVVFVENLIEGMVNIMFDLFIYLIFIICGEVEL